MIGRGEITKAAQAAGVDAQTVERDYVLAHVATEISHVAGESMVLKGGTCLRLAHYTRYRFSADLDYSLRGIEMQSASDAIEEALSRCRESVGFSSIELVTGSDQPRIEYVGPLGAKPRKLKLDLADDELVLEHAQLPVVVGWRDLPEGATLIGYTLTEVCAEKLRCVIQRRECRDVYDLWALLVERGGADLFEAWHRFQRKAEHRSIEPARFFARWDEGIDWYRARWESELEDYLGADCPNFGSVSAALRRVIAELDGERPEPAAGSTDL